ncbi:response regulator transcription factor [Deinococcus sonorensis]|uniref:Response regulator transcription factor n=2 Tax=Deinococcus sonorensis TaxID=309891 RepID=A0AAU7U675_9DEIO
MIRLLIAEDQPLMRRGLRTVLETEDDFTVVAEAGTGAQAVELVRAAQPDVVLMDVQMPELSGVDATRLLAAEGLAGRVLILTTFDREDYVLDALRAGAAGYLLKDVDADELARVIRLIARGESFIQPAVAAKYLRLLTQRPAEPQEPLTARELEVLNLLAAGASNKRIAASLAIAESTVKNHVNNILAKLQVRNRTEAALKARERRDSE